MQGLLDREADPVLNQITCSVSANLPMLAHSCCWVKTTFCAHVQCKLSDGEPQSLTQSLSSMWHEFLQLFKLMTVDTGPRCRHGHFRKQRSILTHDAQDASKAGWYRFIDASKHTKYNNIISKTRVRAPATVSAMNGTVISSVPARPSSALNLNR